MFFGFWGVSQDLLLLLLWQMDRHEHLHMKSLSQYRRVAEDSYSSYGLFVTIRATVPQLARRKEVHSPDVCRLVIVYHH